MKILLFANTDWYLYNFRRSLAQALAAAGHEVLLVSPPGPFGEQLQALGLRWLPAPMERRSLNPAREFALIWWLRRLMIQEEVDLVHGFTIKCVVYGALAARWAGVTARVNAITGLGYVFTSRDLMARLLRPLVRVAFRLALGGEQARLVVQNPDDAALFCQAGLVEPERVRLILGSGVNCERFSPVATISDQRQVEGPVRVLLPARLLWDKGLAELVEAARLLREKGRPIHLLLAGEPDAGNPGEIPRAQLRLWEEEKLLDWLGHVKDMPALYRTVDLVVLPSYREGLPKGLIEAAACGLPLVTTDVPGCREVVTDGVEGLLVPARDPAALAEAIGRLAADPELRKRMGIAARAKALACFDERIVISQVLAVYCELVEAKCEEDAKSSLLSSRLLP